MGDYSQVAPPQNFSQSSAFAAALLRAKQVGSDVPGLATRRPGERVFFFADAASERERESDHNMADSARGPRCVSAHRMLGARDRVCLP